MHRQTIIFQFPITRTISLAVKSTRNYGMQLWQSYEASTVSTANDVPVNAVEHVRCPYDRSLLFIHEMFPWTEPVVYWRLSKFRPNRRRHRHPTQFKTAIAGFHLCDLKAPRIYGQPFSATKEPMQPLA